MIKGYRSRSNDMRIVRRFGLLIEGLCYGSYEEALITAAITQDRPGAGCELSKSVEVGAIGGR